MPFRCLFSSPWLSWALSSTRSFLLIFNRQQGLQWWYGAGTWWKEKRRLQLCIVWLSIIIIIVHREYWKFQLFWWWYIFCDQWCKLPHGNNFCSTGGVRIKSVVGGGCVSGDLLFAYLVLFTGVLVVIALLVTVLPGLGDFCDGNSNRLLDKVRQVAALLWHACRSCASCWRRIASDFSLEDKYEASGVALLQAVSPVIIACVPWFMALYQLLLLWRVLLHIFFCCLFVLSWALCRGYCSCIVTPLLKECSRFLKQLISNRSVSGNNTTPWCINDGEDFGLPFALFVAIVAGWKLHSPCLEQSSKINRTDADADDRWPHPTSPLIKT